METIFDSCLLLIGVHFQLQPLGPPVGGGRPLRRLQEVTCVVAVCSQDRWEPRKAHRLAFKHCIVFPDLLPADVLCGGREARALGRGWGS